MSTVTAFVGREDDLAKVDELLLQNQVNIAAAVGMGGVGKTELALQYARRRSEKFPGGVCWLRGIEPIALQMISFAHDHLALVVPEQTERPVAWCVQRWPGEGAVLVVVDDVQDYGALKAVLPSDRRFRVLLTTRSAILPVGQRLALEVLLPRAALELLMNLAGEVRIQAELDEARALCEWVGYLPLGVELVGWYLEQRPWVTVAKLLERLEEKRLAARALTETRPEMNAELGVAAAFEVSWELLTAAAKEWAGLLGLFAAAPIDWAWVMAAGGYAGLDKEDMEDARAKLLRVNLLQVTRVDSELRYQLHPLIREFFGVKRGELFESERCQAGFAQAMTDIAKTLPQTVTIAARAQMTETVVHMEEVTRRWTTGLEDHDKTWCCTGLSLFYESLSQWKEAEAYRKRALEISKAELGDRHPETASSLNNLAELYKLQGRYANAEPLYLEALEINKAELGNRHPHTATSLNNLAGLYWSQGHYTDAEPLYLEALEINKAELGNRHPSTATSLNNLAGLYFSQGRYADAEPLYSEALEIRKAELGDHHPHTASSLNNLAELYKLQGRYANAEPLYLEALEINKAELGNRHPSTATSLNNLALIYYYANRLLEAVSTMTQALCLMEELLGPKHPNMVTFQENLEGIQTKLRENPSAEINSNNS